MKVGVVGFTTEATPSLLFPGNLGPVRGATRGRQR